MTRAILLVFLYHLQIQIPGLVQREDTPCPPQRCFDVVGFQFNEF